MADEVLSLFSSHVTSFRSSYLYLRLLTATLTELMRDAAFLEPRAVWMASNLMPVALD